MKKLYLLAAFWLLNGFAFAQQDTVFVGRTQASYDSLFSELDWDKITTGVLVDKTIVFSNLSSFNGSGDEKADISNWGQLYLEYFNASKDRSGIDSVTKVSKRTPLFVVFRRRTAKQK